jgi:gamma-glutamylcyclotransferase (GGCT)/AIG2-like uncharacterized protein YtfP
MDSFNDEIKKPADEPADANKKSADEPADEIKKPADENKKPATNAVKPTTEDQNPSISYDSEEFKKLPRMARKFMRGLCFEDPRDYESFMRFRPQYMFFYGTLMDPVQLRKVLQLEDTPVLQPARIIGWKIMLWGQYPALVFKQNNITHGMAYEVQKESQMEYLKYYETEAYRVQGCMIKLSDGTEIRGKTFIYNGDANLLKEGTFDLKDWQMEQLEKKS